MLTSLFSFYVDFSILILNMHLGIHTVKITELILQRITSPPPFPEPRAFQFVTLQLSDGWELKQKINED